MICPQSAELQHCGPLSYKLQYNQNTSKFAACPPENRAHRGELAFSGATPQLLRPRTRPVEHQSVAAHAQLDRHIAAGAFGPAVRTDVPHVLHPVARSDRAEAVAPAQ